MTRGLETAEFPGRAPADPGPVELAHTFTQERSKMDLPPGFGIGVGIAAVLVVLMWPRGTGPARVVREVVFNGWGILCAMFIAVALLLEIGRRLGVLSP